MLQQYRSVMNYSEPRVKSKCSFPGDTVVLVSSLSGQTLTFAFH